MPQVVISPKGHGKRDKRDVTTSTHDLDYALTWLNNVAPAFEHFGSIRQRVNNLAKQYVRTQGIDPKALHLLTTNRDVQNHEFYISFGMLVNAAYEHAGIKRIQHDFDTPKLCSLCENWTGTLINTGTLDDAGLNMQGIIINLGTIYQPNIRQQGILFTIDHTMSMDTGCLEVKVYHDGIWKMRTPRKSNWGSAPTLDENDPILPKLQEIVRYFDNPQAIPQTLLDETIEEYCSR